MSKITKKMTKINKDTNLGNGKVWTNRVKQIILCSSLKAI